MHGVHARRGRGVVVVSVVVNAMLAGASLDQAVKQLPARHRMGVQAFAEYSAAADLGNGVAWYAGLGLTAAALALAAVVAAWGTGSRGRVLSVAVGAATLGWLVVTAFAAPLAFSQLDAAGDPATLARIFDRFEALNLLRAGMQVVVVAALAGVLIVRRATVATPDRPRALR